MTDSTVVARAKLSCLRAVLWMVPALAATIIGCQNKPEVVVSNLPTLSILQNNNTVSRHHHRYSQPGRRAVSYEHPSIGDIPRSWIPSVPARPWRWIVIHHSATHFGSARVFDRAHRARGWDELGYHFVIDNGHGGRDGRVEVGSRWIKQKWGAHCGGTPNNEYNNYGIGICLVGDFSKTLPSNRQLRSLRKLLIFLMRRYRIPPSNVIGHRDAPGASTACPGNAFYRYLNTVLRPELSREAVLATNR